MKAERERRQNENDGKTIEFLTSQFFIYFTSCAGSQP